MLQNRHLQNWHLTPLERALCSAAAAGRLFDLRCRRADEDDPARGRAWSKNRQIRAQVLRQLLTGEGYLDKTFGQPLAVRLRGVSVTGRLNLGGCTVRCPLELYDCYLPGRLDLAKAEASDISLRGSHLAQRLSARRLRMTHGLNLTGSFRCYGRVDLRDGHIGGSLDCAEATLSNTSSRMRRLVSLLQTGRDWPGEELAQQLRVSPRTLRRYVGRLRKLGYPIQAQRGVAGGYQLAAGTALTADGLTVGRNLFLSGAEVTGEVRLIGARVRGQLSCGGATLSNPGGQALTADGLTVDGSLFLRRGCVTGEVILRGARVGGQVACDDATLSNPRGRALDLEHAVVTEAVFMRPKKLDGSIHLRAARVGSWHDKKDTWPRALNLQGFVYDAINVSNVTPKQRLDWLHLQDDGYRPQPYEQLASVYRRAGHARAARTVAIAKQRARRARAKPWWVRTLSLAWSFVLRWTIGYGYRPALVLPYLAGLFVIGWVVFDHAYPANIVSAAKSGSPQPEFHPARYTLDLLLPVASLRQREAFLPHGYAAWWAFGLMIAGWLLAAIVVAGLAGVFKRD
jgi:biotin operon repressor